MTRYAEGTTVPVEKTRAEIETIITRYGATKFSFGMDSDQGLAVVRFYMSDRFVQFKLKLPGRDDKEFRYTKDRHPRRRTDEKTYQSWEQGCRQRWRALALAIKAKLEAVESGISTFEYEFLAHIILPNGQTAGDWLAPQIASAYQSGQMPTTLLGLPAPDEPIPRIEEDEDQ